MNFITEIGPEGLRSRPAGVQQDHERRHLLCILLTITVLVLQCVQIMIEELIWEQNQLYLAAEFAYINEDVLRPPMRLHQVERAHKALLEGWVRNPRLNVGMMVGRPRVRLLYIKPGTCLYPVHRNVCHKRLNLEYIGKQIDTRRNFENVTLKGVQCPPLLNSNDIKLKYHRNAQLGDLNSQGCFECEYPRGGYVLDIPRPNLTIQSLDQYKSLCLEPLNREIFNKFVDEGTRLIQLDFSFYAKFPDVFLRVTVAFEEFDLNRWWPSYNIETTHFLGLLFRGNYHSPVDDVKILGIPVLVIILILIRLSLEPQPHRIYRIFLSMISIALTAWRLASQVKAVSRYEEVLYSLPLVAANWTRLEKVEQLMKEEKYFPFFYLKSQNKEARDAGITLVLASLLHLCQYDNYYWHEVTLLVVSFRKALLYSMPFILYFLAFNFVFAVIGHSLFGVCTFFFSEKTQAFIKLIQFQFLGDMDHEELMICAPGWGEAYFYITSVVLYIVLFNFTFSYVFGMMSEVRRLKTRQLMLQKQDDQLEKINWPVTRCHRGADLSLDDQLRLITLFNFLSAYKDSSPRGPLRKVNELENKDK